MPCKGEELCDEGVHETGHESNGSGLTTPIPLKPTQPMPIPGSNPQSDETFHSFVEMSLGKTMLNESSQSTKSAEILDYPSPSTEKLNEVKKPTEVKPVLVAWDNINSMPGEEVKPDNVWDMIHCRVFLSNYRIIIITNDRQGICSIPISNIDAVETHAEEMFKIMTKDGKIFSFKARQENGTGFQFFKTTAPTAFTNSRRLDECFAYKFASAVQQRKPSWLRKLNSNPSDTSFSNLIREFNHCGFKNDEWRITKMNEDFSVCASYPQYLVVPASCPDDEFKTHRRGRFFDRFPSAVWRSRKTGAVLLRSAQPEISFFGNLQEGDARLFQEIKKVVMVEKKKMMIMDARSYTAAWANRAKGGGFESGEAYTGADVVFLSLPNIHALRYSFAQLRTYISSNDLAFLGNLSTCNWFQYMYSLIINSQRCADHLCVEGLSVLVHCSDGWDRTSQITSLAKLLSDPYYRTFEGFEHLINREWVEYGHKFSDRNGFGLDNGERSPVFMQFLDAVHQLWLKNPDCFEFNQRYLMKLAQHHNSSLFGTFLFNCCQEALNGQFCNSTNSALPQFQVGSPEDESIVNFARVPLVSVFDYLGRHNHCFFNPCFEPSKRGRLLVPKGIFELSLWKEVYCCTDVEMVVNSPDRPIAQDISVHEAPHTPQDQHKERTGMSRSQSAASLNSLEQATTIFSGSLVLNGTSSQPPISSTPTMNGFFGAQLGTRKDRTNWKHNLDTDGLSRVPIDYEDKVLEIYNRSHPEYQYHNRTSESSSGRGIPSAEGNHVLRQRVESNDSSFSYDMLEDDSMNARRKRDSTSSNYIFPVDMNSTQRDHFGSLNEEVVGQCDVCHTNFTMEANPLLISSTSTLVNGSINNSPSKMRNGGVTCARCSENKVHLRSPNRMIIS